MTCRPANGTGNAKNVPRTVIGFPISPEQFLKTPTSRSGIGIASRISCSLVRRVFDRAVELYQRCADMGLSEDNDVAVMNRPRLSSVRFVCRHDRTSIYDSNGRRADRAW
jgi:hypothetical protein